MICDPGWADLSRYVLTSRGEVETRWMHRPYTVLLITGLVVDVVDAPPRIADVLLRHLHMAGRSVAAAEVGGRVLLLFAAGPAVDPARAADWSRMGVLFHQRGSWTALPPSIVDGVRTRWQRPLDRRDLALPSADSSLDLLDHLCPPPPPPIRGMVCMTRPPRADDMLITDGWRR